MSNLGRDEHKKSRGKRFLAQTPKNQISDGIDIEFSNELADQDDVVALTRIQKAEQRKR